MILVLGAVMLPDDALNGLLGKGGQRMSDAQGANRGPQDSDLGTTTIQDAVVTAIIGIAAEEVDDVAMSHGGARLPRDSSPTVGEFVDNITGGTSRARGLSVDVGERQTAADLTVNVDYGHSIPQLTKAVIERVQNLTGLEVTEVNIQVNVVNLPPGQIHVSRSALQHFRLKEGYG
jgi:uncharacterized alkaline shock family protein YloU